MENTLLQFGAYLDGVDNVEERNFAGFNSADKQKWAQVAARADAFELQHVLRKYRKQLTAQFGAEAVAAAGLNRQPDATDPVLHCRANRSGAVELLTGNVRLSGDSFAAYVALCKEYRLRFNADLKVWAVMPGAVRTFDVAAFESDCMVRLNLRIASFAEVFDLARKLVGDTPPERQYEETKKTLTVSRDSSGKFSIAFPYDAGLVALFNNKAGHITGITAYNPATKARETMSIDLVDEVLAKVAAKFPELLIITNGVDEARIERDEQRRLLQMPIPGVASQLAEGYSLRPYQNQMVHFLDSCNGNALVGDEMGLGKTLQSLAWAAKNSKKVLVVGPKVMRRTWIKEAKKFFPNYFNGIELVSERLRQGEYATLAGYNIASVNYESVHKFQALIIDAGFDLLIIDESHRMKNPKAKTTQMLTALASRFEHKILMSGTAIKNKKVELFTQLKLVAPHLFLSAHDLKMATVGDTWNRMQVCYLARQKGEVLKDLPPKVTTLMRLDVEGLTETVVKTIADVTKLKTELALAKVPNTIAFVQELLDGSDSKVLVFSDSLAAAEAIAAAFGDLAMLHHGQQSDDSREATKERFQSPECSARVLVSTRQSLAVGATLTAADKVVFNDLPWTAADVRQAEDRTHRIGQPNAVNVYWMVAENSLFDSGIADLVMAKYQLAKAVTEGRQLTEAERAWMDLPLDMSELLDSIAKKSRSKRSKSA